jgi:molybdate transport system regulatory protein
MELPDNINYQIKGKIWIEINDKTLIGEGKVILLMKTAELGSLRKAAEATGISYRQAWYSINRMNNVAEFPLIHLKHGGEKGGIATLTEYGEKVISAYKKAEEEFHKFLNNQSEKLNLNQ